MPEFYGSQRLFWYLIVAVTLNGASLVILTYFLVERAKAGSTAVWHFFAVFERCLPAWSVPTLGIHIVPYKKGQGSASACAVNRCFRAHT